MMTARPDAQTAYDPDYLLGVETTAQKLRRHNFNEAESDREAVKQAKAETGLPLERFPSQYPYELAAVIDDQFLPS